jgi:type IV fimbrial biogenesis protein FimT
MMNSNKGFTLLELMVAIAVLAILLSIAVPNYNAQIAATRLRADADNVVTALQLARSEAVTRRTQVTVSNLATGATVMQGGASIRVFPALSAGIAIDGADVTYRPDGSVLAVDPAGISVTGASDARTICVNYIGQARMLVGAVACP